MYDELFKQRSEEEILKDEIDAARLKEISERIMSIKESCEKITAALDTEKFLGKERDALLDELQALIKEEIDLEEEKGKLDLQHFLQAA